MSSEKSLTEQIQARGTLIAAEKAREWTALAKLGEAVHDSGAGGEAIREFRERAEKAADEIRKLRESLRQLLADEKTRAALAEEKKSLNVELRNIRNKESSLLEELGRECWSAWKSGVQNEDMEDALADLIKAENRFQSADGAVFQNESTGASRRSVFSKGRALLLAGRRRNASAALERLWGHAGREVMAKVSASTLKGTAAAAPVAALSALDSRREEIQNRLNDLSEETSRLDAALEDIPGRGNPRRRSAHIEKAIEEGKSSLEDAYRLLGQSWLDSGSEESPAPEVERCRVEWNESRLRIQGLEGERRDLEAHRRVLETERTRERQMALVESLDSEIKERTAILKKEKKHLANLEKEISKLRDALPPLPS